MTQDIALWAIGGISSVLLVFGTFILNSIKKQGDDTNAKVTLLTVENATMKTAHIALTSRVDSLDKWRDDEKSRHIREAEKRIGELEDALRERDANRRQVTDRGAL